MCLLRWCIYCRRRLHENLFRDLVTEFNSNPLSPAPWRRHYCQVYQEWESDSFKHWITLKNHSIQYSIKKQDRIIHTQNLFSQKIQNNSFKENIHSSEKLIITQGYVRTLPQNSIFHPKNTALRQFFSQFIHVSHEYCIFLFIQ